MLIFKCVTHPGVRPKGDAESVLKQACQKGLGLYDNT